jgi:hypothetical protein
VTNADKYGALAVAEGRVSVSWRVDDGAPVAPGTLRLRWAEAGGPAVAGPPARRGFGSRVLDGTIRRQLGGEVSLAWNAEGLVCGLEIPLGRAAGTAAGPTGEDRARAAVAALRRFGDRLGAAERRVREAEARVTHQSLIIASIDGDRHPGQAILARRTLATLQRSLETARERLRVERANRRPAAVPAGSGEREVAVGAAGRAAEQAPEADR